MSGGIGVLGVNRGGGGIGVLAVNRGAVLVRWR